VGLDSHSLLKKKLELFGKEVQLARMRNLSPQVNFFFIAFVQIMILPSMAMADDQLNNSSGATKVHVGVVLDMKGRLGKMGLSCMSMALSDFYASHASYRTRVVLKRRDSKGDDLGAAAAGSLSLSRACFGQLMQLEIIVVQMP